MRWRKLGQLFCPDNTADWMISHAANPVAELLDDRQVRIYFTSRDGLSRSHVGFFEIDIREPMRILRIAEQPLVRPGVPGMFDDSGAAMGCLVVRGGTRYLYYLGWNLGVTVPWRNSIGLAIAEGDTLAFEKFWNAPLLDRAHVDPFSISYPMVRVENNRWRMWYGSNLTWGPRAEDMAHVIKYAESDDGLVWRRDGRTVVGFERPEEYALSKPWVLSQGGSLAMWYSYRGENYRIGYAESADGLSWRRLDHKAGIDVSPSGWDSEMIEYPCVFDVPNGRYMLYNGNGYGRTGIGMAILESM